MPLSLSGLIDRFRAPAPDPKRVAFLQGKNYAHRGLHGEGRVENSMSAFRAAVSAGYGVELDVRITSDAMAVVFHDETLERLTKETGRVDEKSRNALLRIPFAEGKETIPDLGDVLSMVAGRAPVLIEIKAEGVNVSKICVAVRRALVGYHGNAAVMSFNPEVVRWFRRHAKHVTRGLVITEGSDVDMAAALKARFTRHGLLWRAKPDFIAYDIRNLPSKFAAAQRARCIPVLTWTVRTDDERERGGAHADALIFETIAS